MFGHFFDMVAKHRLKRREKKRAEGIKYYLGRYGIEATDDIEDWTEA